MDTRDGQTMLSECIGAYAGFGTYSDLGVSREVLSVDGQAVAYHGRFETRFIRGVGLRFVCWEHIPFAPEPTQVILRFQRGACSVWDSASGKSRHAPTLERALLDIILESRAASVLVPALLFGRTGMTDHLQFGSLTIESEEELDGIPVWRLGAHHPRLGRTQMWIDQRTRAFRRLEYVADEQMFSFSCSVEQPMVESDLDTPFST